MKYSKIVPIHDDGKASVECLYCPELIIFKRNAGIMDPEGPACKHLVDWQVKPNKTLEVLFEATGATEKAKKERTLGDVLDEFLRYLASVQGGDMTLTCERTGLYEAAIRAAGERMQAEINALRGGIEAHKVEAGRRWNSCMPPEYINGKDDPEGGKMCPFFDESKYGNCGASDEGCFQDIKQWTQCGTWIETIENIRDKARQTKIEAHNFATARAKYATASLSMDAVKTVDDVINKAAHSIGMEVVPEDEMHKYETLDTPDHTASCVFLPVHINGLMRGHARLPIIGHCVDPDGCAVIVRLGKVEFPLPIDFDPSK